MVRKRLAPMVNLTVTLEGKVLSTMPGGILMAVIGTSIASSVSTSGYTDNLTVDGTILTPRIFLIFTAWRMVS